MTSPFSCALLLLAACGTGFSTASPDGRGSSDGGVGTDSAPAGEGASPDTGGAETGALEDGNAESGTAQGGGDSGSVVEASTPGTYCGPSLVCTGATGQQGTVCCVADTGSPTYQCAGSNCGCDTQLDCASDDDCPGKQCCIERATANCASGHYVATCRSLCGTATHMCNPADAQSTCLTTQSCSTDTSSVGLPVDVGFGICN